MTTSAYTAFKKMNFKNKICNYYMREQLSLMGSFQLPYTLGLDTFESVNFKQIVIMGRKGPLSEIGNSMVLAFGNYREGLNITYPPHKWDIDIIWEIC